MRLAHQVKHKVPKTLLPVVNSVLNEVSTLGFTGLVVGTLGLGEEEGIREGSRRAWRSSRPPARPSWA